MVRITAVFIAGIVLAIFDQGKLSFTWTPGILPLLSSVYLVAFFLFYRSRSLSLISGVLGLAVVFLSGYLTLLYRSDFYRSHRISDYHGQISYYSGRIASNAEERDRTFRMELEVEAIESGGKWFNFTGKSLLYFAKDKLPFVLNYGDQLLIRGPLTEVPAPPNPGEFDFRKFLSYRNITHMQFAHRNQVRLVRKNESVNLMTLSQRARTWASSRLETFVSGTRERSITRALVLGITEGLDNDLLGAYAASGTMHVLSVSGLHVGIIYGIVLFFLRPLRTQSWSRWLVAALSLICLWSYAFITGLSPSVLRSVTMFSFIVIAKPFGRQTNIYNTLAASAFLLLIFDPYLVMSVGFQLSYLAVMGIVYLQRPLYNLWEPSSLIADKIWQAVSVSLAAQLATFAVGLYYFHQFPVYFLLANLIVVPASSLVLVVGIFLLAVNAIPVLAVFTGQALTVLIDFLNRIVFFIEELPGSLIEGVQITAPQCWMLIGALTFLVLLFQFRKFSYAVVAALALAIFSGLQWHQLSKEIRQRSFIVYDIPGRRAMEWTTGGHAYFYADSALVSSEEMIRYHVQPNRVRLGISRKGVEANSTKFYRQQKSFQLFQLCGFTVLRIDKWPAICPENVVVDYLVIGNNALTSLGQIRTRISFRQLIFDSSNSKPCVEGLVREAKAENIAAYDVVSKGAFTVTP